jgi:hypothetical protein
MCLIAQPVQRINGRGVAHNNVGCLMELYELADCYATLRDFIAKFDPKKISKKKFQKKNFKKFSVKFFFQIFFGYQCSAAILGYACKKIWGLGPLV